MITLLKNPLGYVELTLDVSDSSPHSPDPLSCCLSEKEARDLIWRLYELFPQLDTPGKAMQRGYDNAKAHIQFPVCACHFADDEETLISPCMAHLEWAKGLPRANED